MTLAWRLKAEAVKVRLCIAGKRVRPGEVLLATEAQLGNARHYFERVADDPSTPEDEELAAWAEAVNLGDARHEDVTVELLPPEPEGTADAEGSADELASDDDEDEDEVADEPPAVDEAASAKSPAPRSKKGASRRSSKKKGAAATLVSEGVAEPTNTELTAAPSEAVKP